MKTILDTGPLVALMNRRDRFHEWTLQAWDGLAAPLWTCEPVLTEAAYLTRKPEAILGMVHDGAVRIGLEIEDQADGISALIARYGARMDLADACVVRMSELTRRCQVFTLDRSDFSVFRRNGRDVIPLLAPGR